MPVDVSKLDEMGYLKRSMYAPLALILPVILSAASWMMNGLPFLTDLSFACLTLICAAYFFMELYNFPQRFGIGGIILYGGVMIWFGHDYFNHWIGHGLASNAHDIFTPEIIAKATFCHCLFILFLSLGLMIPFHRPLTRLIHAVPEPNTQTFYLWMLAGLFFIGILPYLLFTRDSFLVSIWRDMWAGRGGGGAKWTVSRTGNVNYSFGAYAAVLIQMGQLGGQMAVFYALLVTRNPLGKIFAWAIWAFWLALAFGSGSRGQVLFMALPAVALLYLKYQSYAAVVFRKVSARAYILTLLAALGVLFLVQFQGYFRTVGFGSEQASTQRLQLFNLRGNTMFSEGLLGYAMIPDVENHYYNQVPGEMLLRPIPQTLYWFLVGPIPRAIWTTKPIDPVWAWYNYAFTGGRHATGGTTISQGLVGYWYFRYGLAGVIQGGLLIGWLMRVAEKSLQNAQGKPIRILFSLGFATWLFRMFRGVNFNDLYPLIIGGVVLYVLIQMFNLTVTRPGQSQLASPSHLS